MLPGCQASLLCDVRRCDRHALPLQMQALFPIPYESPTNRPFNLGVRIMRLKTSSAPALSHALTITIFTLAAGT